MPDSAQRKADLPPVIPPELARRGPIAVNEIAADDPDNKGMRLIAPDNPTPEQEAAQERESKPKARKVWRSTKKIKIGKKTVTVKTKYSEGVAMGNPSQKVRVTVVPAPKTPAGCVTVTFVVKKKNGDVTNEIRNIQVNESNPHAGLTREQVLEVHALQYPDEPEREPNLGDMTPAFIAWLKRKHPADYAVRYHGRIVNGRII